MKVLPLLKKLRRDERGISAVEYAILIAVVGIGMLTAFNGIAGKIGTFVGGQVDKLNTEATSD
jgi:Flp pilus assembly pilin Flp